MLASVSRQLTWDAKVCAWDTDLSVPGVLGFLRYHACKCHFPILGLVVVLVLILILESWFCNLENAPLRLTVYTARC